MTGAPLPVPAVGSLLGRYRLLSLLGKGGMGAVYRARDEQLGRPVALKVLLTLDDPGLRERFAREARAVAALRHPGIVALLDAGQEQGVPWIAMELVEGETLQKTLAPSSGKTSLLEPRASARIVAEVARALEHAHAQGIVHRDLKPANVLLERDGRARVADFGLARSAADAQKGLSASGQIVGTPAYMSPEQAAGEPATELSDVYGAGAILYEALTSRPPHDGPTAANILFSVIQKEPPAPRTLNARVHPDLETVCQKALEKEPARRYASAADLAADLERFLRGEPIEARPPGALERLRRRVGRSRAVVALALLVAFLGLSTGGVSLAVSWRREADARRQEAADRARREEEARLARAKAAFLARLEKEPDPGALVAAATEALARPATADEVAFFARGAPERETYLRTRRLVARERLGEEAFLDPSIDRAAVGAGLDEDAVALDGLAPAERGRWTWARLLAALIRGRRADVGSLVDRCASEDPTGPYGCLAEALRASRKGDGTAAVERARAAVERAKGAVDVIVAAGLQLQNLETIDEALVVFDKVGDARPRCRLAAIKSEILRIDLGGLGFYRNRQYAAALPHFERANELDPRDPFTAVLLMRSLAGLQRFDDLERFTGRAVLLLPDENEVFTQRGYVLVRLGRYAEALEPLRRAIQLEARSMRPHYFLARALQRLGRNAEALPCASEAVRLATPGDPTALQIRGQIEAALGQRDAALVDLDAAIGVMPPGDAFTKRLRENRERIARGEPWISGSGPAEGGDAR